MILSSVHPENLTLHVSNYRPLPCTSMRVFEFCWLMFITAKGEDDCFSEDLVSSSHLLYACCDLAFKNIFLDDRRDLLNPKFSGKFSG